MKQHKIKLMLDSGIFSAWQRDEELPIKDYIAYIKDLEPYLASYVCMDSIPGKAGVKRDNQQVAKSAELSYKNQQIMRNAGLAPIPVFHQGESFSWLEKYLKDGEMHIGISSAKDLSHKINATWLDTVFTMLTNKDGRPIVRTHGFGITKPAFLLRYPWATVDSTTWSLNPGFGFAVIPAMGRGGKPDYSRPTGVHISTTDFEQRVGAVEFDRLGRIQQEWIIKCLERAGVTLTEARNFSDSRRKVVLFYYMQLAETVKDVRFMHRHTVHSKKKPVDIEHLEIVFSTMIGNKTFSRLLNEAGAYNRLLSYYETKKRPREQIIEYVNKGIIKLREVRSAGNHDWDSEAYRNRRRKSVITRNIPVDETPPWE